MPEGNVGSGTGMICHGFKGGIGTSSRVVAGSVGDAGGDEAGNAGGDEAGNAGGEAAGDAGGEAADSATGDAAGYTLGVLVQANHGSRRRLVIDGFPVGRHSRRECGSPARR